MRQLHHRKNSRQTLEIKNVIKTIMPLLFLMTLCNLCVSVNASIVPEENHLQKHHLGFINGPILITAPHGRAVYRGGPEYGGPAKNEPLRIHQREVYASWIAVQLAHKVTVAPSSFCTWGEGEADMNEKDPNYLLDTMFSGSQFHLGLHAWAESNQNSPLLHVDVHGKADRSVCDIDIGIKSIEEHWGDNDPILNRLINYFTLFSSIFQNSDLPNCQFNTNGIFKGYWRKYKTWKPDRHSMTEQAVELGIPSLQMEIPRAVRNELFSNATFFNNFANGISSLYNTVILPYYQNNEKTVPLSFDSNLGNNYDVTIMSITEAQEAREQLQEMES